MFSIVHILIDPIYARSVWCENLKQSLISELKKKRIHFSLSEGIEHILLEDIVFLIASDNAWTENTIRKLNHNNIQPILLCNQMDFLESSNYSCVCSDVYSSMKSIFSLIKYHDKKSLAIYGLNRKSLSDIGSLKCAQNLSREMDFPLKVFYNDGSLADCFEQFYSEIDFFDSVICVNDFAAVSLIKHLQDKNSALSEQLLIFSCAKSEISELYPNIISPRSNYEDYGKAAVYISEKIEKHRFISNMTIRIARMVDAAISNTSQDIPFTEALTHTDEFYQDQEIAEMICVEKLLCRCDQIDRKIIDMLYKKATLDEICENCYLSESTVKYRIKHILDDCGFHTKDSLLHIITKYL